MPKFLVIRIDGAAERRVDEDGVQGRLMPGERNPTRVTLACGHSFELPWGEAEGMTELAGGGSRETIRYLKKGDAPTPGHGTSNKTKSKVFVGDYRECPICR